MAENASTTPNASGPPDVARTARWYVVMAQPRNEEMALTHLARQGFKAFLPRRWTTKRGARGFRRQLQPVFPRYLFVEFDPDLDRWRSINGTYGVSRLVAFGEWPTPISHQIVETMLASTGEDTALVFTDTLSPGDRVRLISGPFAEQLGVLERLDDQGRVQLLLNFLGSRVRLTTSKADIERLPAAVQA